MVAALVLTAALAAAPEWTPLTQGVEHLSTEGVELFRFPLRKWEADVVVPGAEGLRTARELRVAHGAAAAVNGGFFDVERRPLGLRIAGARRLQGLRRNVDWGVLVISDERASIVHSRDYQPLDSTRAALQVGPRILVDGRPTKLKPQTARRTAVALDAEGGALTLVIAPAPVDAAWLAGMLAKLGFDSALMLDGGPSTQLSLELDGFSREIAGAYPVPDALVLRRRR